MLLQMLLLCMQMQHIINVTVDAGAAYANVAYNQRYCTVDAGAAYANDAYLDDV